MKKKPLALGPTCATPTSTDHLRPSLVTALYVGQIHDKDRSMLTFGGCTIQPSSFHVDYSSESLRGRHMSAWTHLKNRTDAAVTSNQTGKSCSATHHPVQAVLLRYRVSIHRERDAPRFARLLSCYPFPVVLYTPLPVLETNKTALHSRGGQPAMDVGFAEKRRAIKTDEKVQRRCASWSIPVVPQPDAVTDPGAVMIKTLHTVITDGTMDAPRRTVDVTCGQFHRQPDYPTSEHLQVGFLFPRTSRTPYTGA